MDKRNLDQCGFALVEAVMAAAVFAIGVLAIGSLYLKVVKTNHTTYIITDAVEIASAYLDQIQASSYNSIPTFSSLNGTMQYPVSTSITECTSGSCVQGTKIITITITPPYGGGYTFSTVKADIEGLP